MKVDGIDGMDMMTDRELDAQVAARVMGYELAGSGTAVFVEGEWSIHSDSEPDGWACYAGTEPFYVRHCSCRDGVFMFPIAPEDSSERKARYTKINADRQQQFERDRTRFGHSTSCLDVVPYYSTEWDAMQLVAERLAVLGWDVEMNLAASQAGRGCLCVLRTYTPDLLVVAEAADTLPRAVALAALVAVHRE